jgi:hypothetical protein
MVNSEGLFSTTEYLFRRSVIQTDVVINRFDCNHLQIPTCET